MTPELAARLESLITGKPEPQVNGDGDASDLVVLVSNE